MGQNIRIILFTANEGEAPELRRALTSLPSVRIAAELDEPSLLPHAVAQFPADILVVDLQPSVDVVLECVRQLTQSTPGLPVFALSSDTAGDIVLRSMRAGVKEFLVKPLNMEEFEQSLQRSLVTTSQSAQPGRLISVMGSAGGVGATSIAVNLAVELADLVGERKKVCIVDLDFRFGHVATLLDVHGQFTIADLCSTPEQLDPQMIEKAWIKHESGLYVLRRPHSFAQAEMITAAHCAGVLSSLQEMCAYVVVDGPTRHDPGGRIVLDAADHNLFVLQLLVTSVRNTDRMVQELRGQGFNSDRISFICNRVGRESAHLEIGQVETILNRKMFMTITDDWKAMSSSINIGQPLRTEFEKAKIRQDLRALALKLHDPEAYAREEGGRQQGLLGRFLKKKGAVGAAAAAPAQG